ncbi:MG2 domain protein [Posidoniimonas polymericola]|uniref:MG2 domain protein n=1 Tax=Posidoniimonas polymericola TaxID=2528002 RepID=A0A5C5YPY7_9BACT|nr:MG2 domain-containing protein [Posidoniimonas polymericola]TWT76837.1 MG2 domain protein [Posidoniimonas polymericola]
MIPRKKLFLLLLPAAALLSMAFAQNQPPLPPAGGQQAAEDGNWRQAYNDLRSGLLNQTLPEGEITPAIAQAVRCLAELNRVAESDAFLEDVAGQYPQSAAVLLKVAQQYENLPHYGSMVSGEFHRGNMRGRAQVANAYSRDRVRALQLLREATRLEGDPSSAAAVARSLADVMMGSRFQSQPWQLQLLTDIDQLPDYEEGWGHSRGSNQGAPVGADGEPLFYALPESWDAARNDGERWRWAWEQYAQQGDYERTQEQLARARFLESQFGVPTLAQYLPLLARQGEGDSDASIFTLHTLAEDETLARLATGVRRFKLPDEHNHLKLYQEVLASGAAKSLKQPALDAANQLAGLFQNRRQYPRAVEYLDQAIEFAPSEQHPSLKQSRDQITKPWGEFQPAETQPAGQGATVELQYRNAESVEFTARPIKLPQLLADVKAYLESRPDKLEGERLNIDNLGYRMLQEGQEKHLGPAAAEWKLDLAPPAGHFDDQVTVTTPLQQAGAYWVTAKLADGNTCHTVLWLADTAIVRKPLDGKQLYFVADAKSGRPVANATVELFAFRQRPDENQPNRYFVETQKFAEKTDANGMIEVENSKDDENRGYQWLATVATADGRYAYLGFDGFRRATLLHGNYNQTKAFVVTDRPVYRPGQKVHYKAWIQRARYGVDDPASEFAHKSFRVELIDGRNEKVQQLTLTANAYGAVEGEYALPNGATLGGYRLNVLGHGSGGFRVEEYKKPEYEVTVDAPTEGVALGEEFTAKIQAKYYFGAPVVNATVAYKVTRTKKQADWFPPRPWDWLYGPGYGWLGCDFDWHPGFQQWGLRCPSPGWLPWRQPDPPEIVAEAESPLDAEGSLEVSIDTALAKALYGDSDHNYHIEAQVRDESRRTIVGTGDVLAAQQPYRSYVWTTRGHYRVGDPVEVRIAVRTADGRPLAKTGDLKLLKLAYSDDNQPPKETEVRKWELATAADGGAGLQIKASEPGQYRLSFKSQTAAGEVIEGGHVFCIAGEGFDGAGFAFNDLEIVPDKAEYRPGEKVRLQVSTARTGSAVLLFVRPENGVYPAPRLVRLDGKSTFVEIDVQPTDMPNLIVEATAVGGARVHQAVRDIAVPPVSKALKLEVLPGAQAYKPGQEATVKLRLTDRDDQPVVGDAALTIYDKSVEYSSGGSNVGDIRKHFWDWRRTHYPNRTDNLGQYSYNLTPPGEIGMRPLGVFGGRVPATETMTRDKTLTLSRAMPMRRGMAGGDMYFGVPMAMAAEAAPMEDAEADGIGGGGGQAPLVEATVRTEFADTALWDGTLETNSDGIAEVTLTMPENLTTWQVRAWGVGHGARVGEGAAEMVTRKNLIVRLQTPRFLVETDEVVLSANVHNYLGEAKQVTVRLELEGGVLESPSQLSQQIEVPADGDRRVDWRVSAMKEGGAVVRAFALTDEESDAMELTFPVRVHGILKQDAFSGAIAADGSRGTFEIDVPTKRRPEQTRLEVRYSPTLAGAMVDALPYLIDYPHGCTEQTLNRFLPAVLTQQTLIDLGVDLKAIQDKQTNLNPQQLGDAAERATGWKRYDRNPVFDQAELDKIVKAGVRRLTDMQLSDGGWGWFSGYGEHSSAHTTAVVVRGLSVARQNDVALLPNTIERGVEWLKNYQQGELAKLRNVDSDGNRIDDAKPAKQKADNLDALVHLTLVDAGGSDAAMRDFLYRDRTSLAPYSLATLGLALHQEEGQTDKRDMVIQNLKQYVQTDDENQTAWLNLPGGSWWYWYGSEYEAHAYFLKLLAATEPDGDLAAGLVKYLLNNRSHATYWNSTRDTALVVEAMADYLKATGQAKPDLAVEVWLDGEKRKAVKITADNLFTFDGVLVIEGAALTPGRHTVEIRKQGDGRLFYNGYLQNFTLQDDIRRSGLEVRVTRELYKLERVDNEEQVAGGRGQAVGIQTEKYRRQRVSNLAAVASGDLVEVELTLESKNDYEYLLITDPKAAGFEPVEVQSGYNGNEIGAYVEYRDQSVNLFARQLARGKRSVSYRLRAETPGKFSALPTQIEAMYAPELRGNSDEIKVRVIDGGEG